MSADKLPLSFIVIGVPPHHSSVPKEKQAEVERELHDADEEYAACNADVQKYHTTPEQLQETAEYLRSHRLDGVVIGMGVRGNPELTHWFEQLIGAVRQHAPHARLMFNTRPDDALEAIQRWFPQVKSAKQPSAH